MINNNSSINKWIEEELSYECIESTYSLFIPLFTSNQLHCVLEINQRTAKYLYIFDLERRRRESLQFHLDFGYEET